MIKKKIILALLPLFLIVFVNSIHAQSCYELVWGDEFNYNGLPDSTLWTFEEGGSGWGNNELQYYTSKRLENARVEDGVLTIEARKENYNDREYTSARLKTYPNNHSWKYGKIEARIKLPYGQGIWPAFWMLGDGIFEGTSWPGCGELDIMELVGGEGKDNVAHGSIHYTDVNNVHASNTGHYTLSNGIFADNFHVFSIEWTQEKIKWFIDGNQYFSKSLASTELSEFQKEFFLLLNVAVGGNWPGSPNSETVFPQKMQVDYVRVYQLNNQPKIIGDSIINKAQKNIIYKTVESEDFIYDWSVADGVTINDGQGTNSIDVTWGCEPGTVMCQVSTTCSSYNLSLPIKTEKIKIIGKEKLEAFSVNNKYTLPELHETEYQWSFPDDVTLEGENDTNVVVFDWGNSEGIISVSVSNNCGIEYDSINVEIVQQLPYPDPNIKHAIPGTIEAINYDSGGEGFSYHDNDANNQGPGSRQDEGVDTEVNDGGENIGWIQPGEWVEYTVDVDTTGMYNIELRVASLNGGGEMEILFGDENRTGEISIPATGAWSTFTSIYVNDIQLYDTDTLMRLQFNIGDFNISRLIFNKIGTSIENRITDINNISLYPTPTSDFINLKNQKTSYSYSIINLLGKISQSGYINPGNTINISDLQKGTYFIKLYNESESGTLKFIKL
jgi:beta-glucanase (GH16 family)